MDIRGALPDDMLVELCKRMPTPDLISFMEAHISLRRVCADILSKRLLNEFEALLQKAKEGSAGQVISAKIRSRAITINDKDSLVQSLNTIFDIIVRNYPQLSRYIDTVKGIPVNGFHSIVINSQYFIIHRLYRERGGGDYIEGVPHDIPKGMFPSGLQIIVDVRRKDMLFKPLKHIYVSASAKIHR